MNSHQQDKTIQKCIAASIAEGARKEKETMRAQEERKAQTTWCTNTGKSNEQAASRETEEKR